MSRSQSVFVMAQQQDMQQQDVQQQDVQQQDMLFRELCDKNGCYCANCKLIRRAVIRKQLCTNFMRNSSLSSLLNRDKVCVNVKHIEKYPYASEILMLLIQIYSEDNVTSIGQFIIKMANRNLNETRVSTILRKKFENETRFYEMFARKFKETILAECYLITCKTIQLPILLLQDLKADGYAKCHTKLNAVTLRKCIKALACFHGNATIMIYKNAHFKPYMKYLKNQYYDDFTQLGTIRAFLNNSVLTVLDNNLQEKIKNKLKKAHKYLLMKRPVSVLVHGSFTRSKIFIKEDAGENIKFIDFQTVKLGSPAIDLGRILFTNLPDEYNVSQLEKFCRIIINYYILQVIKKTALFNSLMYFNKQTMYRNIINNLLYSYATLDEEETKEIHDHVTLLHVLNNMGAFE